MCGLDCFGKSWEALVACGLGSFESVLNGH